MILERLWPSFGGDKNKKSTKYIGLVGRKCVSLKEEGLGGLKILDILI